MSHPYDQAMIAEMVASAAAEQEAGEGPQMVKKAPPPIFCDNWAMAKGAIEALGAAFAKTWWVGMAVKLLVGLGDHFAASCPKE